MSTNYPLIVAQGITVEGARVSYEHNPATGTFGSYVQTLLHASGYTQKELANVIPLDHKVLSRKLNNSGNAYLTRQELEKIILQLINWNILTTREGVLRLLTETKLETSFFSEQQWQSPPLNSLAIRSISDETKLSSSHSLPAQPTHNLPAPTTRLIGRQWEIERLLPLLTRSDVRLVTLTGSGGSGKTRLAQHIASALLNEFMHGVWFVPLAAVHTPTQLPMSIIQALHIASTPTMPPLQSLLTYLRDKQLLLILDNFEQITDATDIIDEMLAQVPGLTFLITSRVVLHIYGEHEFRILPLDTPASTITLKVAELLQYSAIQLFIERAHATVPGITITDEDILLIRHICNRIDGLPLAIELAAARLKTRSLADLLAQLTKARLPLLIGGARSLPDRQRTLRNTIVWSYQLLSEAEQFWFNRLSVFVGGWSLEDAEAMMGSISTLHHGENMAELLEQLVDHNLLIRTTTAQRRVRFSMLETLREYAQEQLIAQGDFERLHDWHAAYYMQKAETGEMGLRGSHQLAWLHELTQDLSNFQRAMDWLLERTQHNALIALPASTFTQHPRTIASSTILSTHDTLPAFRSALELCLRLAASFRHYWEWQGYLPKAREWLTLALAQPLPPDVDRTTQAARAKALSEAARLLSLENEQQKAIELVEESITLWRQLHDGRGLATALLHRGWTAHAQQDYKIARAVYEEGLTCLENEKDPWLSAQLLLYLGDAAGFTYDFAQMHVFYTQSKALFEQIGDKSAIADLLKDKGGLLILENKYAEAIASLQESILLCEELDHKQYITTGMGILSFAVGLHTEPDAITASIRSAQIGGAAEGLMNAIGLTPWTNTHPYIQLVRQQIRSRVDEKVWENAWAAGRSLTFKQAIELACHSGQSVPTQQPTRTGIPHGLLGDLRTDQPVL